MDYSQHNGHFHLVRVGEHQIVVSIMPARIETEGINVAVGRSEGTTFRELSRHVPSRVPNVKRFREDVVVHKAGVHGENAHEEDDVPSAVDDVSKAKTGQTTTYKKN